MNRREPRKFRKKAAEARESPSAGLSVANWVPYNTTGQIEARYTIHIASRVTGSVLRILMSSHHISPLRTNVCSTMAPPMLLGEARKKGDWRNIWLGRFKHQPRFSGVVNFDSSLAHPDQILESEMGTELARVSPKPI